tara:strand:- start:174 stop:341 length:168 start_codon:yes stop_codon:yes gene_type:complete
MAKKTYTLELTESELILLQTTWQITVTGDRWFDAPIHEPHEKRNGKRLTKKIEAL